MSTTIKIIISWVAFIGMITVNALANFLPINGYNTGQVSDLYPNYFVPDGLTFTIWSVIYLWLLVFLVYSTKILIYQARTDHRAVRIKSVLPVFRLSCLLNASWILAWHYLQVELSVIIMISLLACLLEIILRIHRRSTKYRSRDHFLVEIPFLIYLGWISVATIANVTAMLVYFEWDGFGLTGIFWTICMMFVATLLGVFMSFFQERPTYTLVICWALWGIYRNHAGQSQDIGIAVLIFIFINLFFVINRFLNPRLGRQRTHK